ncbi:hypothetical protein [Halomicrobium sp. LC1Hm]|uniref:DUF7545 family protein n=1 Tax=Halomicrobium sp. LC1Hm TaxID=2610902 RepID=UPI00129856A5|nr:hypothetical protein [Halomicrobium sp. LC1Hm]QGA82815.1 Uncharacterized protein LC1Hm_1772 [Halomicrobium sp. LC1Hm]
MTDDTVTVTLEAGEERDELTVPTALVDMLREGDESDPEVVGDIAMFGMAQRIHGAVHHGQGEPDAEIASVNETAMELFEERFGATFSELTGHDH